MTALGERRSREATNPIIVALDVATLDEASAVVSAVAGAAGAFKVGLELYAAHGPAALSVADEFPVFLDLKLHDIPTTVARAVRALRPLQAELLTVHALGGRAMLEAANDAKRDEKVLAVTVLTHLEDDALREMGLPAAADAVPLLAELAFVSGCDGVVCAPADLERVRAVCPRPFVVVTPGVRPAGSARDEQARALTPAEAIALGADRLVVGRPITRAPDPRAAAEAILREIRR